MESPNSQNKRPKLKPTFKVSHVNSGTRQPRSAQLKVEIANFAGDTSIHQASKKYNCDRKCVRDYISNKWKYEDLVNEPGNSKRIRLEGGGRRSKYAGIESEVALWIKKQRDLRYPVSRRLISVEAYRLAREMPHLLDEKDPKFTEAWIDRFLARNGFTLRRKTTMCQKEPTFFIPKIVGFVLFIRQLRNQHGYLLNDIIACDETPVWMDFVSDTTVDVKGAKEVCVKTTGHEKTKLSVMLAAKADGQKLRPHVVINRVRPIEALKKFKCKLHITYAKKSLFDDEITEDFLKNVIRKDFFSKRRLLVWDSFRCHISEKTKQTCKNYNLDMAVVPGGTTKYIQPADVCWNKVFKQKLKHFYTEWLINGEKSYTKGGNVKAVDFALICEWIVSAWDEVSTETIINSFKTCGITIEPDGSEDNLIHCLKPGSSCEEGLQILNEASQSVKAQELIECPDEYFENVDDCEDDYEVIDSFVNLEI